MTNAILTFIGWDDPTRRAVLGRGIVAGIGYMISNGTIQLPAWAYDVMADPGMAAMVGALLIPAGQKNPVPEQMPATPG